LFVLQELKGIDLECFWNPLLFIENVLSETKEATWLAAMANSKGEVFILERRRVRGVFMENLELNDFPLDVQVGVFLCSAVQSCMLCFSKDLTVTITSERPDTEIDIIPDENEMSGINVQTFVDQQVNHPALRLHPITSSLCAHVMYTRFVVHFMLRKDFERDEGIKHQLRMI
jgi:hypothetical protein